MWSQSDPHDPADILRRLEECLAALDAIGADLPAVHLAAAIEFLRSQYGLPEIPSGLD